MHDSHNVDEQTFRLEEDSPYSPRMHLDLLHIPWSHEPFLCRGGGHWTRRSQCGTIQVVVVDREGILHRLSGVLLSETGASSLVGSRTETPEQAHRL